jgi:hypothetical protein
MQQDVLLWPGVYSQNVAGMFALPPGAVLDQSTLNGHKLPEAANFSGERSDRGYPSQHFAYLREPKVPSGKQPQSINDPVPHFR